MQGLGTSLHGLPPGINIAGAQAAYQPTTSPRQETLRAILGECLNGMGECERHVSIIDGALFGIEPEADNPCKAASEPSLETLVLAMRTRLRELNSQLMAIQERL